MEISKDVMKKTPFSTSRISHVLHIFLNKQRMKLLNPRIQVTRGFSNIQVKNAFGVVKGGSVP